MHEKNRDRILFLGEERREMDFEVLAFVILDVDCEVWEGIDVSFCFSPVKEVPMSLPTCIGRRQL